MSRIMRQLYAEARAAREAAERTTPRPADPIGGAAPQPTPSSIEWWKAQYEQAGRGVAELDCKARHSPRPCHRAS